MVFYVNTKLIWLFLLLLGLPAQAVKSIQHPRLVGMLLPACESILGEVQRGKLQKNKLRSAALGSRIVSNKLLEPAQVVYLLAWKAQVNPSSKPFTLVYGAMGADIVTGLLATDANVIHGIDILGPSPDDFRIWLERWQEVEKDLMSSLTLKALKAASPSDWYWELRAEGATGPHRRFYGYWNVASIEEYGIARLALYELKAMGIKKDDIAVSLENGSETVVSFPWKHPDGQFCERKIVFHHRYLDHALSSDRFLNLRPDGVYIRGFFSGPSEFEVRQAASILGSGGVFIGGYSWLSGENDLETFHGNGKRAFGTTAGILGVDREMELETSDAMNIQGVATNYGWRLYGLRKP